MKLTYTRMQVINTTLDPKMAFGLRFRQSITCGASNVAVCSISMFVHLFKNRPERDALSWFMKLSRMIAHLAFTPFPRDELIKFQSQKKLTLKI